MSTPARSSIRSSRRRSNASGGLSLTPTTSPTSSPGAGFEVERDELAYPHRVPRERYFKMVRGYYMWILTSFERDELEAGLVEMKELYGDRDILTFTETSDYVTGRKS
jgi:hypothetical protein